MGPEAVLEAPEVVEDASDFEAQLALSEAQQKPHHGDRCRALPRGPRRWPTVQWSRPDCRTD